MELTEFDAITIKQEFQDHRPHDNQHHSDNQNHRILSLKTTLQDKGTLLSQTWRELNELLSEYQAELFEKEGKLLTSSTKYENLNDIQQLKHELIQSESENGTLQQKVEELENRNQVLQMDNSVKESLLKKYQQDLLDKEARLLTLQSGNRRLETRVGMLEGKISARAGASVRLSGKMMSGARSGVRQVPPGLKRRLPALGVVEQSTPKRHVPPPLATSTPAAPTTSATLSPSGISTPPGNSQNEEIVCFEVPDDDEIQAVQSNLESGRLESGQLETSSDVNEGVPIYVEQWTSEPEGTQSETLPGYSYDDTYTGQFATQPPEDATGYEEMLGGGGPMDGTRVKAPELTCNVCYKVFYQRSNLIRHKRTIHDKELRFHCISCEKRFGQKMQLDGHCKAMCTICCGLFPCRTMLSHHQRIHHST